MTGVLISTICTPLLRSEKPERYVRKASHCASKQQ